MDITLLLTSRLSDQILQLCFFSLILQEISMSGFPALGYVIFILEDLTKAYWMNHGILY
jgi:hypothetical protein